jgi:DNA mismatch repair protein MutH
LTSWASSADLAEISFTTTSKPSSANLSAMVFPIPRAVAPMIKTSKRVSETSHMRRLQVQSLWMPLRGEMSLLKSLL